MILLVKLGDPRGLKKNRLAVLAFAITIGPWLVLFWMLTRH